MTVNVILTCACDSVYVVAINVAYDDDAYSLDSGEGSSDVEDFS